MFLKIRVRRIERKISKLVSVLEVLYAMTDDDRVPFYEDIVLDISFEIASMQFYLD